MPAYPSGPADSIANITSNCQLALKERNIATIGGKVPLPSVETSTHYH